LLILVTHAEIPEPGRDTDRRILLQETEVQRPFPGLEHVAAARELDDLADAIALAVVGGEGEPACACEQQQDNDQRDELFHVEFSPRYRASSVAQIDPR
jgi:hypothetical protein